MTSRNERTLPFGVQFSPEQTPLPQLLDVLAENGGTYQGIVTGIMNAFFMGGNATPYNRSKKSDNTTLALRNYGILAEDKANLTDFGRQLVALRKDDERLYSTFARHILLNLNGLQFVEAIRDELASKREITLETLPKVLRRRGVVAPRTSTHVSAMKGWLKKAGVFTGDRNSYEVDSARLQELLGGLASDDVDALADVDPLQRAFLRMLARLPGGEWHKSNEVAKAAEVAYGVTFPWKGIPSTVLEACAAAGFLEHQKTTSGRGAKPYLVRTTAKFKADVVAPILEGYRDPLGSRLREYLRTPIKEIIGALDSKNTHVKGKALELLAVALIFTLDLEFVDWRKRGAETGGAEVDVLAESARLLYSRWQIQCKNARASLEDVAKEVGLAYHLNSNVVLVLTTRRFSGDTRGFADSIMKKSNLQIALMDETDLKTISASPLAIFNLMLRESRYAMQIKAFSSTAAQTVGAFDDDADSEEEHGDIA
jgi:site-specific DNA-methyltransferase (cytosine-N4-specific)